MKGYFIKYKTLPVTVKRFADISAEPLFVCNERKFKILSYFTTKKEAVCRKWSRNNTIKCLFILLPAAIILILTGGICISINENKNVFIKDEKNIKNDFILEENDDRKKLLLVNAKSPIPNDYHLNLSNFMGINCDKSLVQYLDLMLKSAKKDGHNLEVFSGFIDRDTKEKLYKQKVKQLINEGYTIIRAEAEAEKLVSSPGKCEYETGLLVDIKAANKTKEEFNSSLDFKWLINNCVDFGFIQRYPAGKEDKTGKNASPFAFRFVGIENAKKMRTLSMCLEEYAQYLRA